MPMPTTFKKPIKDGVLQNDLDADGQQIVDIHELGIGTGEPTHALHIDPGGTPTDPARGIAFGSDVVFFRSASGKAQLTGDLDVTGTVKGGGVALVPASRQILTSGLASGGGDLSVDLTIAVPIASQAEAQAGSDNTKAMTPLRVAQAISALVTSVLVLRGNIDCSGNPNYPSAVKGDTYFVSVAGKIGGGSGKSVDVGDAVICKTDNAGGTEGSVGTSWFVLEHNLVGALLSANNLSDVANAATARTNLGLGTGNSPTFKGLSLVGGVVTVNTPLFLLSQTFNDNSIVFNPFDYDITPTAYSTADNRLGAGTNMLRVLRSGVPSSWIAPDGLVHLADIRTYQNLDLASYGYGTHAYLGSIPWYANGTAGISGNWGIMHFNNGVSDYEGVIIDSQNAPEPFIIKTVKAGSGAARGLAFEINTARAVTIGTDRNATFEKNVAIKPADISFTGTDVIDFAAEGIRTLPITDDETFSTANLAPGKSVTIRIICDGDPHGLAFPAGWTFVGAAAPTTIAANKVAILTATSFGTTDADVVAAYAVQP